MIVYDCVPFHSVAEEIANNLETHYDDVKLKDRYGRPNLDWDTYIALSLNDRCIVITARLGEKLIAYNCFIIGNNINHKSFKDATSSGLWIHKDFRGKVTKDLLRKSEEYLNVMGIDEILYTLNDDRIGLLLKRVGFDAKHIVWSKLIWHGKQ